QDICDAPLLAARLDQPGDPLSVYIREQSDPTPPRTDSAPAPKDRPQTAILADTLNQVLDDQHLYTPERFAGIDLDAKTREMLQEAPDGRSLRRLNLALLQSAYPEAITPNRTIPRNFFIPHGGKGWIFLITTFMAFLLGEAFAPGYATRYCVGKNVRETRWGIAGVGVFLALVFPAVLLFIALYARIHFPDVDPQQVLPLVVRQLNNPIIGGLIIGALLMAVMSSADSALNSATAIFVKDLFEHQLGWQDTGDGRLLKLARICSAGMGAAAILVAVLWSDIIGLLLFTYHVWAPAIIVPVCVGVFSRRRSHRQTVIILATMIIATVGTMLYRLPLMFYNNFSIEITSPRTRGFIETFDPAVFGVLVSLAAFILLSVSARVLWGPPDGGRRTDQATA
ncbi:MAG: hypothetical protein LC725_03405, partial [Lentisphaerae bacterium]|nr:hypothetical protein [Lentisphaerota bacterium]